MAVVLFVCPTDLSVSANSFVEFLRWKSLLEYQWEVQSCSNAQCVAFASALASRISAPFAVDYRWDAQRLTSCQPVETPKVTYLSQWMGPEDESQFLSRFNEANSERLSESGKYFLLIIDRTVMDKTMKSDAVIWSETFTVMRKDFEGEVHEFVLISAQGGDQSLCKALKSCEFIQGVEWLIESSGEDHCVELLKLLSQEFEAEAIVDFSWNGPSGHPEPIRNKCLTYNKESQWPGAEDAQTFQSRIFSHLLKFNGETKFLIIVDRDAFQLFTGEDTGVAVMSYVGGGLNTMQFISLEQLLQRQKVALVCAEECPAAARRVLTELLREFPEEKWTIVAASTPKCPEFAVECAQMLQTTACVDYLWDEFHKRGRTDELPRHSDANYVSSWFGTETQHDFQNRIGNCLLSNFRPKVVCVSREVFACLKLGADLGLAVLDASSDQRLLFSATTEELKAAEQTPQDRQMQNLTAQIVSAVQTAFGSSSDFVPLSSVVQVVAEVLPTVISSHLQSLNEKYLLAIKQNREALEEAVKQWHKDLAQQKETIAGKIDTAANQFQDIERQLTELSSHLQQVAGAGTAVTKRIKDLVDDTRSLRENIKQWHEATDVLVDPVHIVFADSSKVISVNTRLFAIEGTQLLLIQGGDEYVVLTTTLTPGENLLSLSDGVPGGYMLLWKQGQNRLSAPVWVSLDGEFLKDRVTEVERALNTVFSHQQLLKLAELLSDQSYCNLPGEELASQMQS